MASSHSPETRQDRITKEWVAFALSRSERPKRTPRPDRPDPEDERPVEGCPFCPGHEELLPSVLWELNSSGPLPWRTRVVPNKYSAFTTDREAFEHTGALFRSRTSRGHQEVLIETPRHYHSLAQMPVDQVDAVLQTYLERYRTIREASNGLIPFLFRNHGSTAGASIAHPHSQLIAPSFSPPPIEAEEKAARARYEQIGDCPYCVMIEEEQRTDARLVWTSDAFVTFVPYAAQVPYELWILPREHDPEFGRMTEATRRDLAHTLHTVLGRLRDRLDDPDYNFFVRTSLAYESEAPHLHWSLRIRPRTTVRAGFEQSTGIHVNPSIPERDAAVLREDD